MRAGGEHAQAKRANNHHAVNIILVIFIVGIVIIIISVIGIKTFWSSDSLFIFFVRGG